MTKGLCSAKDQIFKFNKNVFDKIFRRKRLLNMRLNDIQKALDKKHSSFLVNLDKQLRKELDDTLEQEELLWF